MATWVIYADPHQDEVRDWAGFERKLAISGFKISCDADMQPDAPNACVYVRDTLAKFSNTRKGDQRAEILARRVRALISNCREANNHE